MKKGLFLSLAIALGLTSCNNEDVFQPTEMADASYMQITVALPTAAGTRSQTNDDGSSTDGEEIGKDYENAVTNLKVVLVNGNNAPIEVVANGGITAGNTYTTHPFPVSSLQAEVEYQVYAVVNYDAVDVISDITDNSKSIADVDLSSTIAQSGKFLMTSARGPVKVITGANLHLYTQQNPLQLGTISVERAAARFDYKQGVEADVHAVDVANITIKEAALINVSNSFYYFKRVSTTGQMGDANNPVIGGLETSTNYVVDHNWNSKDAANVGACGQYFLNYMTNTSAENYGGVYTDLSTLLTSDNYGDNSYKIWTYATENTIRAEESNQVNGLTTGVVFKAQITGDAFNGTDAVYVFNNKVIGNWGAVLASSDVDVKNALTANDLSDKTEANLTVNELATALFTRYTPNEGKYYAYYIYWNRHNDNLKPNEMGVMEFAVVRNNVYKLAVTAIRGFGHPNDPINPNPTPVDPDPFYPDPSNPDEDTNMYMQVSVQILPWTVRVNNIEF